MTQLIIGALVIAAIMIAWLLKELADSETAADEEKMEAYIEYLERRVMELESLNMKYRHEAGYLNAYQIKEDRA